MDFFTHHAYGIFMPTDGACDTVRGFLEREWGFVSSGNPDFWEGEFDVLGVDDARSIRAQCATRPIGERRVVLFSAQSLTREAQNALLKVFEEPGEGNHFFLITPRMGDLLPTLRSRLFILTLDVDTSTEVHTSAKEFLAMSPKDRSTAIAGMIKDKDKKAAATLLDDIIATLHDDAQKKGADVWKASAPTLKELSRLRNYLTQTGSSVKLIMEHVALLLP
jgi:DNA polymerase III delta prime subunit